MKRLLSIMALLFALTFTASAMSYEQAREQALFLTDKMAYELNMTDDQYEAAYEINLDYLMSVNTVDDLYGSYWRYRNLDMSYVLLDWQYRAFCDAAYFYRPLYFSGGYWRFGIYARYPHRDYFYFSRPTVFVSYRGDHSWHMNHGRSWYDGRHFGPRPGDRHFGMRDEFNRGDFGRGNRQTFGNRQIDHSRGNGQSFGNRTNRGQADRRDNNMQGRPQGSFGSRESSTRTTVRQPSADNSQRGTFGSNRNSFGSNRGSGNANRNDRVLNRSNGSSNTPRPTFGPSTDRQPSSSFGSNRGSFGGSRSTGPSVSSPSRSSSPSRVGSPSGSGSSKSGFGSRR